MRFFTAFLAFVLMTSGSFGGVRDVKPEGSAWLDETGLYAGSARDPRNTICKLENQHLHVVQNVYPHYDAMGALEISDPEGALIFRVPIAMGGGHSVVPGGFGYYGKLGYAEDRRPTADSILGTGGVYYRDWSDQEWRVWTRQDKRVAPVEDPVRGIEILPWGMPDFQREEFAQRFRWMYSPRGTDYLFQMKGGTRSLDFWLVPRMTGDEPVQQGWHSRRHPVAMVTGTDRERRRLVAVEDGETEVPLPAGQFTTVYFPSGEEEHTPFFTLHRTDGWSEAALRIGLSRDKTKYGRYSMSLQQVRDARQRVYIRFGYLPAGKAELTARPFELPRDYLLRIRPSAGRQVYVRGERIALVLENRLPGGDHGLKLRLETRDGRLITERRVQEAAGENRLTVPTARLDTGNHVLWAEGRHAGRPVRCRFDFYVAPPHPEQGFVRHMYGMGCSPSFLPWLRSHGFNTVYRYAKRRNFQQVLDLAPKYGVKVIASLQHSTSHGKAEDCNNNPEALRKNVEHFAAFMEDYGSYPGLGYVSSRSEVGDPFCGCRFCRERMREETDLDRWLELDERKQYEPGIIADSNPYVRFVHWWKSRGGIATLHSALDRTIQKANPEIPTLHDEGFLSVGHSWAGYVNGMYSPLDILMKWTYVNPLTQVPFWTKALMGAADPGQSVLPNTQLLWKPGMVADTAHALTPEIVREATWLTVMWGPGSMSHWASFLVRPEDERTYTPADKGDFKGLVYQPETGRELARIWEGPLGQLAPSIARMEVPQSRVGMLYSYTDEAFTVWGHQGRLHRRFRDVLRAHLPVDVVFEEDITDGRLSDYEVLIVSGIRYMRRSVQERLRRFARDGGLLVVDEQMGIELPGRRVAVEDAPGLREAVVSGLEDPLYVDCSADDAYVNVLTGGGVNYVFVVNDQREFGSVVGENNKVREKGVPQKVSVNLAEESATVYELTRSRKLTTRPTGSGLGVDLELPPAGGRILAVYPRPIARVQMSVLPTAETGDTIDMAVRVLTEDDERAPGVQPLKVVVERPNGTRVIRRTAAEGGLCRIKLPIPDTAQIGEWTLRATDLTTGESVSKAVEVQKGKQQTAIGWEQMQ
jgi:hypothetical protein